MGSFISYSLVCAACLAWQQDPPVAHAPGSPEASKGKILILESQRVLEGDIERVGEHYRIRRGMGEVLTPAANAIALCASWDEAYQFMRSRANLGDPEERMRLARWCHLNCLRTHAMTEVTAAVEMRPEYPEAKQLHALLTRAAAKQESAPTSVPKAKKADNRIDLSAESLAVFMTHVQPILLNACATCHTAGRGGLFQLHRPAESGGQRGAVQRTLAAVIEHVNMERPALSPLLVKAVSVHFPAGPAPLVGRQTQAFKTLERWVMSLPDANPHLREASAGTKTTHAFEPPTDLRPTTEVSVRPTPRVPAELPAPKSSAPSFVPAALSPPANVTSVAQPAAPSDPFDPLIFNRQMHPKR